MEDAAATTTPAARAFEYGAWRAPSEDGQLLIWPGPPGLLDDALENGRLLRGAHDVRVQNVPLPEIRRRLRAFIGHEDDAVPLIGTGHQAELHHPGVWVKNVLIDAMAARLGGQAHHFAVDTDAPKHLALRWPGGGNVPLTDDPDAARAPWSGLLDPPTPAHLQTVAGAFEAASQGWDFDPLTPRFVETLRPLLLEPRDLPATLTQALHALDWSLGLRHHAMTVSPLWQSEPYLAFVHHVLARAGGFAADYNAALAAYRLLNKIKAPGRPMPDLQSSPDRCEVPFWLDDLSATPARSRPSVTRAGDGDAWSLAPPGGAGDPFRFDPSADGWRAAESLGAWLRRHNLRLAPRALTLTTVLRLLATDQFVHGIGGGQYDQVTDRVIATHFRLRPPRFAVTTATLYFPPAAGQPRACVPCVRLEGHRLRHDLLGGEKAALVEAIAAAPRRSQRRQALFHEMHARLNAAAATHPAVRAWEQRVRETAEREVEERTLFDRELFYAIQPEERLAEMIRRYHAAFE